MRGINDEAPPGDDDGDKKAKLWAYDLEAKNWDEVTCAVAISDVGDVERFVGPDSLAQIAQFQIDVGGTWVAHAGGIYDTLLVSGARGRPWREVVMSGSAVLCAKDRGNLKVRDTFRWWLAGLGKVGGYLEKLEAVERDAGRPAEPVGKWKKKDVDRKRIEDLSDAEALAYCESDTEILLKGVQTARAYMAERNARSAWTAGASALSLLEALEPASWALLGAYQLPYQTAIAAGQAVRGARVENWALGRVDSVYVYDLKSAYPAAYATKAIGIGARHVEPGGLHVPGTVWRVKWCWPWRDRVPPVLDQATGAGHGWCEAWVVEEELEELEDYVGVQKLEGWAPEITARVGQVFAKTLYDEKEAGSFFGKTFLNSGHGKFSESPIKECWTNERPRSWHGPEPERIGDYWRYFKASHDVRGMCARHIQPVAAAQILGRTRATLWGWIRAVLEAGGEVYYCDTDSVHCNLPPDKMPRPLGVSLGDLAFEGGPFVGYYCGPKAYCLVDPATGVPCKGALKGVPWKSLEDGVAISRDIFGARRFRQARGKETGSDVRLDVFLDALEVGGGASVVKEGIASWVQGLRRKAGWSRSEIERTINPQEGGKAFRPAVSSTTWGYLSPTERMRLSSAPSINTADVATVDGEPQIDFWE